MGSPAWTTGGPFIASTHLLDEKYKDETDSVPAQYDVIMNTYTPKDRKKYVQMLPYTGLGIFTEKFEGDALEGDWQAAEPVLKDPADIYPPATAAKTKTKKPT